MTKLPRAASADEIFSIDDRPLQEIDIPEWQRSIVVRELDARTMSLISKSTVDDKGNVNSEEFSARVVYEGIVEPKMEPHHIEMLKTRNHAAFMRIYQAISGKKKEQ